ncbi:MAG: hypothetical protein NT085_01835 [candidate division SR1 bacterium]|nr:hypothetical protein [candidate division SR1 bacterium]
MINKNLSADKWIEHFIASIKKESINIGNLYRAELKIILIVLPLIEKGNKEQIRQIRNFLMNKLHVIIDMELLRARNDQKNAMILSVEMINNIFVLECITENQLQKIKEFLENELKREKEKRGNLLEYSLKKQLGDKISDRIYFEKPIDIHTIAEIERDILNCYLEECLDLEHNNVAEKNISDIIINHYNGEGYENKTIKKNSFIFFKDKRSKLVSLSWYPHRILISSNFG